MTNIMDSWLIPTYTPRPIQHKALEWIQDQYKTGKTKYFFIQAPVGCHAYGTPVIMYNGTVKQVQDVLVGDLLMGPDSKPRKVLRLFRGQEKMYEVTPSTGDPFICNKSHILSLITTETNFTGSEIINITIEDYLSQSDDFKRHVKLYRPSEIEFHESNTCNLPIEPYLLGLLLGDITTQDTEIINLSTKDRNILLENLRSLDVHEVTSETKFIPQVYKTSSKKARLQLLAGLIDIDGYYEHEFNYCTTSAQMCNDVKFVARSLGFSANHIERSGDDNTYYHIAISGDLTKIPTKIAEKQAKPEKQTKQATTSDFTLIERPTSDFYGFELDGDHLYLLGDFTVTHNSGKSLIGMTAANWIATQEPYSEQHSYILTPQRILQKQYENSFDRSLLASLYGKSNYSCHQRNTTCDIGSILKPTCGGCPYKQAKTLAKQTRNTVLNYKIALLAFKYTEIFKRRPTIILDECHTIEEYLTELDAATISYGRAQKYGVRWEQHDKFADAYKWVNEEYLPKVDKYISDLDNELQHLLDNKFAEPTEAELKKLRELTKTIDHADSIKEITLLPLESLTDTFVFVHDKEMKKFKRLNGGYNFKRILEPFGNNFIFMSSTILNYKGFCKDLDIDPSKAAYIDLTSEFEPENRPVFFMPQMKMNASWSKPENKKNREKMLVRIMEILVMHKNDSGIIHTGNFAISKWLVEELEHGAPHKIFHHNPDSGDDRNRVIEAFQQYPKPSILISPSITEGLDLKDDLARFAIIAKVPFGFLGDQWIRRRMELSKEWYNRRALIDIIQGAGRVVRSHTDWGNTYILDESFRYLLMQTQDMVPKWWLEAYREL